MNSLKKVVIIFLVVVLCISFVGINVYAEWNDIDQFDDYSDTDLDEDAKNIVGAIVSVVRISAVGVAIIMLAFVAIKYMTSAPGDRADIKKHAVVYVVGALVLFGGSGILGIIQDFAGTI